MQQIINSILVSIANILVMVSLIPSIRSEQKPHINTCIMNILVSLIFVIAFSVIGLWIVVTWNILIGLVWGYLTYQVKKRNGQPKEKQNIDIKIIDEKVDSLESYD